MAERDSRAYEELDRLIDEGGTAEDAELAQLLATVGTVRESLAVPAPPAESSQIAAALAAAHRRALRLRLLALSLVVIAALVVGGTLGTGEQSGERTQDDQQGAPGPSGAGVPGDEGPKTRSQRRAGDPGDGVRGHASEGRGRNGGGRRRARPASSVEGYSEVRGDVLDVLGADRPGER